MNFSELDKIIQDAGISICPICGTPFDKRHYRQQTCGSRECKTLWKNKYLKERRERLKSEDPDAYRERNAEAQRKSRRNKKRKQRIEENLNRMERYWETQTHVTAITDDGIYYGKRQMEKTLALVPKIDVEGFRKEIEKNDDIHGDDTQTRG